MLESHRIFCGIPRVLFAKFSLALITKGFPAERLYTSHAKPPQYSVKFSWSYDFVSCLSSNCYAHKRETCDVFVPQLEHHTRHLIFLCTYLWSISPYATGNHCITSMYILLIILMSRFCFPGQLHGKWLVSKDLANNIDTKERVCVLTWRVWCFWWQELAQDVGHWSL